jgi:hypothetical protein
MRRPIVVLAVVVGFSGLASAARAQSVPALAGFNPFSAYQGYYIPSAVAAASSPVSVAQINQQAAVRSRYTAIAGGGERPGLYDELQPLGLDELDPNAPPSQQRSLARRALGSRRSSLGTSNTNLAGTGPPQYFNRAATYYPTLRGGRATQRSSNMQLRVGQRRVGQGGGMGMGMGMGMR